MLNFVKEVQEPFKNTSDKMKLLAVALAITWLTISPVSNLIKLNQIKSNLIKFNYIKLNLI